MKALLNVLLLAVVLCGCGGGDPAVVSEPEPTPINPAQRFAGTWTGYFDIAPADCATVNSRTVTWVISVDPQPNVLIIGDTAYNPRLFSPKGDFFEWYDTVGLQSYTEVTTRFQITGEATARLTVDSVKNNIGVYYCSSRWIAELKRNS